ncbi:MAG: alanine racemase [Bacteroidetes bacterium]|nr:alanine racemase [Bacteroidota bacterium]
MKLNLPYDEFCQSIIGEHLCGPQHFIIDKVVYDSRKIATSEGQAFFALKGDFRDGNDFLNDAYRKGIRIFVISEIPNKPHKNAAYILVQDTLVALQNLAAQHRNKFKYPVIAITGSNGKTTVKEWLYHLLSDKMRIIRSPKSYNSQLGVALSLLEMHEKADLAIIEAGISKAREMDALQKMIQPDYGIFTSFGSAHEEGFSSDLKHLEEKLKLFFGCKKTLVSSTIHLSKNQMSQINGVLINSSEYTKESTFFPFTDKPSILSGTLALAASKSLGKLDLERVKSLPRLAMRMETFEGRDNSIIINDTYNLDLDALEFSLEYQLAISEEKKRIVLVGLDEANKHKEQDLIQILKKFKPDSYQFVFQGQNPKLDISNAVVLVKGTRKSEMEKLASRLRLKKHKTFVEINLSAIKHNVQVYKSQLKPSTRMLAMVKAQSYGAGLEKIGLYLEKQGIDYLGVAYPDEGVELRKAGVKVPILVMNTVDEGFEDCIKYQLEPTVFSFEQLDELLHELIFQGVQNFPVHVKIDTGMRRLGFDLKELPRLMEVIQAQPEISIKGVYSHLADSDNRRDKRFTDLQIRRFVEACNYISSNFVGKFITHLLNSEGITNFPEAQFNMVRIGIGMYGVSSNPALVKKLRPVISWKSTVSQVKQIQKGESVGYSRSFVADKNMEIAIVPVGYADGFRRSLSNGVGSVVINGQICHIIGRVCMDMIMVDVTKKFVKTGDRVELIADKITLSQFAEKMQTISYEVLTSISKRVHRTYIEE